jgi:uncharacterized membrane protein
MRLKQRIATAISILIFGYIFFQLLDNTRIVIWTQVPWWGLILMAIGLFLAIDYLINRLLK